MKPLTRHQMEETLISLSAQIGKRVTYVETMGLDNSSLFWKVNGLLENLNCIQFTTQERNDFLFANFK